MSSTTSVCLKDQNRLHWSLYWFDSGFQLRVREDPRQAKTMSNAGSSKAETEGVNCNHDPPLTSNLLFLLPNPNHTVTLSCLP